MIKNPLANAGDMRDAGNPWVGKIHLEEEMASHYSILAWKIHGQRSLADYSPWGCKESDTTKQLSMHAHRVNNWYYYDVSILL